MANEMTEVERLARFMHEACRDYVRTAEGAPESRLPRWEAIKELHRLRHLAVAAAILMAGYTPPADLGAGI